MIDQHTTRELARGDASPLAHAMARAFAADPVMRWVLEESWDRYAPRYFEVLIGQFRRSGYGLTTPDLSGLALWSRPGTARGGILARCIVWIRMMYLFRSGFARALRIERALGPYQPSQPHWYLSMLGVEPDARRRGIASALLAPVLRRCDDDRALAYLECSNPDSIPFYRSRGFEVVREIQIPDGPRMWAMAREPRGRGTLPPSTAGGP